MSTSLIGAWVPGLPHVLSAEKSSSWQKLHRAFVTLSEDVDRLNPDVIVLYSSQWLSVLGTSFQVQKNPKGVHVDENWHEWGDLPFDFYSDVELGRDFAKSVAGSGIPTKTVDYEEFPIDTGTIVALQYLNAKRKIPVSIVSSWVYANPESSRKIGEAMADTVHKSGKKALFVASSLLSARYFTDEIDPKEDKISTAGDDKWNQTLLGLMELGNLQELSKLSGTFTKEVPTDMQFNAYHWLTGALKGTGAKAKVLAYGPQWGTGAAVAEFFGERKSS
jgi:2-aminophenol/2-amino-5-chlorophenol 1,6-dioxygenase subunit alpha